jgi:multicomponent Na+:H+ antiporter subunit F
MMFEIATAITLISMAMVLLRAVKGPTVYDRILAVNTFGTLSVVLIALYGFLDGRPEFLDIAMVYALINFIATIAVTKYIKFARLGRTADVEEAEDI